MGWFKKTVNKIKGGGKNVANAGKKGAHVVADRAKDVKKTTTGLGKDLTRITVKKGSNWWQTALGAAVMYTMAAVIGIWLALFGVNYPEMKTAVLNSFPNQSGSPAGQGAPQPEGADSSADAGVELALPEFCSEVEDLSGVELSDFGRQDQTTAFIELRKSPGFQKSSYAIDLEPSEYVYFCALKDSRTIRCTGDQLPSEYYQQFLTVQLQENSQCKGLGFSQQFPGNAIALKPSDDAGAETAGGPYCDGSISGFATYDEQECFNAGGDFDESYCHCQ